MSQAERLVHITTDSIVLGALLKWAGIAATGGEAKTLVRSGMVRVNGVIERRRGRRVVPGDVVEVVRHGRVRVVREWR